MRPEDRSRELENPATQLLATSNQLTASMHPVMRKTLGDLVRSMNCYYSNLIEGHNTHPVDINRALAGDYSAEPKKRNLQFEASWGLRRNPESPKVCASPSQESETALDQGPRRRPFRPQRNQNQQGKPQRPAGIRPPGNPRQATANARNNFERYTTMAKDAVRRGDTVEAENLYQHAEHYFRVMREQE
jgi:hypothetical protein